MADLPKYTQLLLLSLLLMGPLNCLAQFNSVRVGDVTSKVSFLGSEGRTVEGWTGEIFRTLELSRDTARPINNPVVLLDTLTEAVELGRLPIDRIKVTSPYGERVHPITGKPDFHNGVDLRARSLIVKAVQTGFIAKIDYSPKLGKYIEVKSGGFEFIYGHLEYIYVTEGQIVDIGSALGMTGESGRATAEHLHFGIRSSGRYIDPLPILELLEDHQLSKLLP